MKVDVGKLEWTRKPKAWSVEDGRVEIITSPHTDLWQRTYYHFRNDNAPVLQMTTDERYFSFVVRTELKAVTGSTSAVSSCIWTVRTG